MAAFIYYIALFFAKVLDMLDRDNDADDSPFTIYDDIRDKLVAKGIPREQIAFIHEANTEVRKKELFAKVRTGQVRVLIGSTFKMGAGMNVQDRLVALHDLDAPWRPGDLEQRSGRIIRQGNMNPEVHIYRYVTEATFDAYLWQTLENKQKFISQIMTSKSPVRSCDDIDETALSYAEIIVDAIHNNYHDNRLDTKNICAQLGHNFGMERVSYLLAVTVQFKDHDGRFSDANKAWAKTVPIVPNSTEWGDDRSVYLVVDQAHPGLVDLLVTQVRKELAQEKEQPEKKPSILEKIKNTSVKEAAAVPKKQREEVL